MFMSTNRNLSLPMKNKHAHPSDKFHSTKLIWFLNKIFEF